MSDTLSHRGPDSSGTWIDESLGVGLGHRRLAIRDLSPGGHQPMVSSCGRWVISYNGEVYSHLELAAELRARGRSFRGTSDTEVILEGFAELGVAATVDRLIGMFAIAAWDRDERVLHLVRDRLGIKPLYWADLGGTVLFGSELKALHAVPGWRPTIDRDALVAYLRFGYVPAPRTIHPGVQKVSPGTIIRIPLGGAPRTTCYWDLARIAAHGLADPLTASDAEILDGLDELLTDAVERRLVADVPLGTLLSGGVDSSLVTAIVQERARRPVRTFSIGFDVAGYDEAPHAAAVARHLGTEHTELYATAQQALALVDRLPQVFDEPFADSSQIPTLLVSELTKREVTVALSGDGGDELFAGYERYSLGRSGVGSIARLPLPVRRFAGAAIVRVPEGVLDRAAGLLPGVRRIDHAGRKAHKLGRALGATSLDEMYLDAMSLWPEPTRLVLGGSEPSGILADPVLGDPEIVGDIPGALERMQLRDLLSYLPDDILTKVDRASMAVALEARVPLLDHRVVELAWRLPRSCKVRNGETKWALRRLLDRRVPRHLVDRPKQGFAIPLATWLRTDLREWAEHLLGERRLHDQGLLDATIVRGAWTEHLAGTDRSAALWSVLMLQSWIDANPRVGM